MAPHYDNQHVAFEKISASDGENEIREIFIAVIMTKLKFLSYFTWRVVSMFWLHGHF